jgi:hypothetical protein
VFLLIVSLGACESETEFAPPPMDWDEMIVNGRASTVEEARDAMAFRVIVPSLVGVPDRIVITDPESGPPRFRLVGFVFEDPVIGRFWIIEALSQTTQEELESLAGCTGCEGSWSAVQLPRYNRGLLIEGDIATSIIWLDSGRRFEAVGPSGVFDGPAAIDVASKTIRSER